MSMRVQFEEVQICMLTRNEGLLLEFTLRELKRFFTKFAIVDQSSTDDSVQIIRDTLGKSVNLVSRPEGYIRGIGFAGARNFVSELCVRPWIFHVDADEQVVSTASEEIVAEDAPPNSDFLRVSRRNLAAPQSSDVELTADFIGSLAVESYEKHVRLYKRGSGLRWHSFIHEELRQHGRHLPHDTPTCSMYFNHLSRFKNHDCVEEKEDFYGWMMMKGLKHPPTKDDALSDYSMNVLKDHAPYFEARAARYSKKMGGAEEI